MSRETIFDRVNHTELYQLCQRANLPVRPNEARETMIAYLEGELEPTPLDDADHAIHTWRQGLIGFAREYWKQLSTQITCPMKELQTNPRPCYGCLDTQVVSCLVNNRENAHLIERHTLKKKK